jgi:hypothetical protein
MRLKLALIWVVFSFFLTAPGCLDKGSDTFEIHSTAMRTAQTLELKSSGGQVVAASGNVSFFYNSPSIDRDVSVNLQSYSKNNYPGIGLPANLCLLSDYHVFSFFDFKEKSKVSLTIKFDPASADLSLPGNIDVYEFDNLTNQWKKISENRVADFEKGLITVDTGHLGVFAAAAYLYDPVIDFKMENYIFSSARLWKNFDANGKIINSRDSTRGYDIFVSDSSHLKEAKTLLSLTGHQTAAGYSEILKKLVILDHFKDEILLMNPLGVIEKNIHTSDFRVSDLRVNAGRGAWSSLVFSGVPMAGHKADIFGSENGSFLASSLSLENGADTDKSEIFYYEINTGKTVRVTYNDVDDFAPAWSVKGREIYFLRQDPLTGFSRIYMWDTHSKASRPVGTGSEDFSASKIIPSRDGDSLILVPSGRLVSANRGSVTGSIRSETEHLLPGGIQFVDTGSGVDAGPILNVFEIDENSVIIEAYIQNTVNNSRPQIG